MQLTRSDAPAATQRVRCDASLALGRNRGMRCSASAKYYDHARRHNLCGVHASHRSVVRGTGETWSDADYDIMPGLIDCPTMYEFAGKEIGRNIQIADMTESQLAEYEKALSDWALHVALEIESKRTAIEIRRNALKASA